MLPAAPLLLSAAGRSSLSTSERTRLTRAGLAARRMSELLRGSAISVVRNDASAAPGAAAAPGAPEPPPSMSRCTSGTMSVAIECLSWMTSMSDALGTSSEAMMRASRRMLSA
jgi:hypothetical protein